MPTIQVIVARTIEQMVPKMLEASESRSEEDPYRIWRYGRVRRRGCERLWRRLPPSAPSVKCVNVIVNKNVYFMV